MLKMIVADRSWMMTLVAVALRPLAAIVMVIGPKDPSSPSMSKVVSVTFVMRICSSSSSHSRYEIGRPSSRYMMFDTQPHCVGSRYGASSEHPVWVTSQTHSQVSSLHTNGSVQVCSCVHSHLQVSGLSAL